MILSLIHIYDPAYLEFEDRTDDLRRDYETAKIKMCIRDRYTATGTPVYENEGCQQLSTYLAIDFLKGRGSK